MTTDARRDTLVTGVEQITQWDMAHRLPRARLVDRIGFLLDAAAGRRTIHVGFVDSGCTELQQSHATWLHGILAETTSSLVGLDIDVDGVQRAREDGYEAYAVDCRDPVAVAGLGLEPADTVIAGEIIEHVDDPGAFLDGLVPLVRPDGALVITTPNACGLVNAVSALAGFEVMHPDHVTLFTWYTLNNVLRRHGWRPLETAVYVPRVKEAHGTTPRDRVLGLGARAVLGLERVCARMGRGFVADGLIVVAGRPDVEP